ncbi:HD domain-containing protein [Desulfosudis oleivorans]|uniref:Metal dependent phosphohydrolase n=1 Tax=Desulfosudis oleivorans (strain DSM 6200 / JCM 39069 / Hxd3) TaxID=96561 RepID=A9A0E8_DESOH|nr:HD domain-containing protein [Desulfosudis oleivorans]ABW67448.1 metal dependent phosphohydrolase [Desulfosudis oleivorans Hxd3]
MLIRIETIVRGLLENTGGSHDWEHTRRVVGLSRTIGAAEGADMEVVIAAAFLHDIGRNHQDGSNGKICHAQKGARMAEEILENFPLPAERKANILHCVAAHRFRRPPEPETLEAKVVFDADKIDAIGAVGVARAYLFAGELGAKLHNPDIDVEKAPAYSKDDTGFREYRVKLRLIKDRMLTKTGKKMAEARHRFMETFFEQFLTEYSGEV